MWYKAWLVPEYTVESRKPSVSWEAGRTGGRDTNQSTHVGDRIRPRQEKVPGGHQRTVGGIVLYSPGHITRCSSWITNLDAHAHQLLHHILRNAVLRATAHAAVTRGVFPDGRSDDAERLVCEILVQVSNFERSPRLGRHQLVLRQVRLPWTSRHPYSMIRIRLRALG